MKRSELIDKADAIYKLAGLLYEAADFGEDTLKILIKVIQKEITELQNQLI